MRGVQPMLATAGSLPTEPGWAYEFKWDGVRTLVGTGAAGFTLTSRLVSVNPEIGRAHV